MKHRTANILGFILIMLGIIIFGLSFLYYGTKLNIGTAAGLFVIVLGFAVRLVFYRCPKCGAMIAWRPLIIKHCQNCGQRL